MKCKLCKKKIVITNSNTRNVKYCSIECREKFYYINYRKEWQLNKADEKALKPSKNKIQCQICLKWYRQVGSHIVNRHQMLAKDYRYEYGFDVKRGQLPEDLRELKASQVFENGTVKNLKKGKVFWFKKGQKGVGIYKRSKQTVERLKKQFKK